MDEDTLNDGSVEGGGCGNLYRSFMEKDVSEALRNVGCWAHTGFSWVRDSSAPPLFLAVNPPDLLPQLVTGLH